LILFRIQGQSNACASFPCYNGGSCTPAGASFLCTCKQPYTGPQCIGANNGMIRYKYLFSILNNIIYYLVNPCSSSPCTNGGMYV